MYETKELDRIRFGNNLLIGANDRIAFIKSANDR